MYISTVSPSRIKTYDQCLYKYYLNYHTDEELKTNWGAMHGSLLHNILEAYVEGTLTDCIDALYRGYRGEFEHPGRSGEMETMESPLGWAKPRDFAEKKAYCDSCPQADKNGTCRISGESLDDLSGCPKSLFAESVDLMEKMKRNYAKIWPKVLRDKDTDAPIGVEYEFFVPIPGTNVLFKGFADLVIEHDEDTIEIIDYKFGTWTQDEDECRQDIQVKGYSWAARQEFIHDINGRGYNYKYVILTFDYARDIPITLTFTEEEDERTARELEFKVKEIQQTTRISRVTDSPDRNFKCKYLCDLAVCKRTWEGDFEVGEEYGKKD